MNFLSFLLKMHELRYIEIHGLTAAPTLHDFTAWEMRTSVLETGSFSSSSALLDQIQSNCQWTARSNLMSLPTDCCQRDERRGWMGDAALGASVNWFNHEMVRAFFVRAFSLKMVRAFSFVHFRSCIFAENGSCIFVRAFSLKMVRAFSFVHFRCSPCVLCEVLLIFALVLWAEIVLRRVCDAHDGRSRPEYRR
jgi:hypothetical protein